MLQVQTVTTDDFVNFASDKPEKKSRVINLSQYGPTYFGPEHAQVLISPCEPMCNKGFKCSNDSVFFNTVSFCVQVLSSHLMHSSLPGLTRLEQMFLVALADTVATTSAEVPSSTDQQYTGTLYLCMCPL